jgi:hypothetical protein
MSGRNYKWMLALVAAALFFGVSRAQWGLVADRERLGLNPSTELRGAPPVLALTTVALGGFRGLISNMLWMRASDLQDQDKFFEMVQLADWITKLEPRFAQVWVVQAWNMAFNISVKFNDPADRWRWVSKGLELLRDDGLKYNPYDVLIHRELGWIFQFKMGDNLDDANMYYKMAWAQEMTALFGGDKPNWDELINPTSEDAKKRAALLRTKYGMDPVFMKQVDDTYGPLEWRLPEAHAIYWGMQGLEMAEKNERRIDPDTLIQLRRIVYQSMQLSFRRGRILRVGTGANGQMIDFAPNLALIAKANAAYEEAIRNEPDKYQRDLTTAHRNLLMDAAYFFHTYGRDQDAQQWYHYLGQKYPNVLMFAGNPDSLPGKMSLDDYAIARVQDEVGTLGQYKTRAVITGLERQSLMSIALGDNDRAEGYDAMAKQIWQRYEKKIGPGAGNDVRLYIPTTQEIRQDALKDLLTPGTLPPEAVGVLETQLGITNLPAMTNAATNSETNSVTAPPPQ